MSDTAKTQSRPSSSHSNLHSSTNNSVNNGKVKSQNRPKTSVSTRCGNNSTSDTSMRSRSGSATRRVKSAPAKRYFTSFEEEEKRHGRYPVMFRFEPKFMPRLTSYSHCWDAQRWDNKYYGEHRVKVVEAKSMVDTKPPQTYMHLHLKLKKLQLEEERLATIERDNRILLEKMAHIMRTQGRVDNKNPYEYKSLNREKRMRELIRVTQENQTILQRILSRKPDYNHKKWHDDWELKEKYIDMISSYPKEWWKMTGKNESRAPSQRSHRSGAPQRSPSQMSKTSKKSSRSQKQVEQQQQEDEEESVK